MDLDENDVTALLKELKRIISDPYITLPQNGEKIQRDLVSLVNTRNKFSINIYSGGIDKEKYSFHARYLNTNTPILRIDTGDVMHKNPDGKIIHGPHMHVYVNNQEIREAIHFDVTNKDIVSICKEFLIMINVNFFQVKKMFTISDYLT